MKKYPICCLICLNLFMAFSVARAKSDGREILEKAVHRQNYQDATLHVRLQKTKRSTGRTKTMTLVVYQKVWPQMVTTLVQLESPEEARGISFLTWDYKDHQTPDEKWYYLPQINRYQKLDPVEGAKYEERFGFSMEIFAVDLAAADHKLLGEEAVDGVKCWKVESVMKDPLNSRGARILTWVRQDNYLAAKIQAFNPQGEMIREFKLTDLKQFGPYWQEMAGTYVDNVKGQTLVFQITDAKFDARLSDDLFLSAKLQEKAEKMRKSKPQ